MKKQNDIKITVLPTRLEEEEVYIQPKEQETNCILEDFFDEDQLDGFSILKDEYEDEDDYEREAEECANHLEQLKGGV